MARVSLIIEDSLHEALTRAFEEGEFDTQKAFYNLILTKGYYAYINNNSDDDEVTEERPRLSKTGLIHLLRETYRGEDGDFIDYVSSSIIFRYRDGEIEFMKEMGTVPGAVADMLIDGWKLNFRLKALFLYYIFTPRTIQGMDLSFLVKDDQRHPLFTVLQVFDKISLLPEEELRVKYLLKNFEDWNMQSFKEDNDGNN